MNKIYRSVLKNLPILSRME